MLCKTKSTIQESNNSTADSRARSRAIPNIELQRDVAQELYKARDETVRGKPAVPEEGFDVIADLPTVCANHMTNVLSETGTDTVLVALHGVIVMRLQPKTMTT